MQHQHGGVLLYAAGSSITQTGGFDFSKPPFHHWGVKIGLLHDGFFLFAVVRQMVMVLSLNNQNKKS